MINTANLLKILLTLLLTSNVYASSQLPMMSIKPLKQNLKSPLPILKPTQVTLNKPSASIQNIKQPQAARQPTYIECNNSDEFNAESIPSLENKSNDELFPSTKTECA